MLAQLLNVCARYAMRSKLLEDERHDGWVFVAVDGTSRCGYHDGRM